MKNFFKLDKPTLSFEIFPPKGKGDLSKIFDTVDALASLDPDLISVTYGAGGTSRENTAEIASRIQNDYAIPALAHLTCIGSTREEMRATLGRLRDMGIKNILAMRGDIDGEGTKDFAHASDLIRFINENYKFNIFAACYPEKHIEAYSMEEDLAHLSDKCRFGVDVLISQLFFDNAYFYKFRDSVRKLGISAPIEAGIMPVTSPSQISRMVTMCGASMPPAVQKIVRAYGHNSMAMREAGIAYATNQIIDLLAEGVDGIHLYTMNLPEIAKRICENIRGVLYSLRVKRG
ncbi:methylenetetrahydrofolate reductase [NAD(P)H] [Synergistes jonesii]|uniref:Methylenetetrahydrofolate reductase n=1 Tax=Synergistes jonesii TaxID=2754 RepID=A0A073IUA6_9BACT|nr:methylenetetrahydrofolate reductase [NAD(P)H] [Synergistes jonesii]KEJ93170.1 5,10-methylenetetrahydrofolate reductase [Synergistes jonesii]OFB60714.1 5,10-methylenetetrahydrofolate reductase [Synergistes jonesii]OFB64789.1 5,10-methylenetetrahydrofolate reductase [Synergistes jonesii]OFB66090.1 5,10-methylenetetrahydrofolate reductase [Synergistes jonesii]OFB68949.1 5,10-methylenetetrahydrofolate reductase [Synergistes jonesii]